MRILKFRKSISLIAVFYIILFSIFSMGFLITHAEHDCGEHHVEHECTVCVYIDGLLEFEKRLGSINASGGVFTLIVNVSVAIVLVFWEMVLLPTPVTLKVKMNN